MLHWRHGCYDWRHPHKSSENVSWVDENGDMRVVGNTAIGVVVPQEKLHVGGRVSTRETLSWWRCQTESDKTGGRLPYSSGAL